jgi:hypothetical protein
MNYSVTWRRKADMGLMGLWLRAADKDDVTYVAEQIERILQRDPHEQGESRGGNIRLWFYRPLCVLYRINEPAKVAEIGRIKWVGR